jgi:hypothetical protein
VEQERRPVEVGIDGIFVLHSSQVKGVATCPQIKKKRNIISPGPKGCFLLVFSFVCNPILESSVFSNNIFSTMTSIWYGSLKALYLDSRYIGYKGS